MAKYAITLRNAASNLDLLCQTFCTIARIVGDQTFGMEGLAGILASEGLMSSKGRTGKDARARSYRKKSSLDSMLMQAKAYAEIYRLLGWMRSESNKKRTIYRITWLGKLLASLDDPIPLMEACFLGITLPTGGMIRQCKCVKKLLWCYLEQLYASSTPLTKEDLVCLCHFCPESEEPTDQGLFIPDLPASKSTHEIQSIDDLARKAGIQVNTLLNSTRLPIAALKRFGWTVQPAEPYSLSDKGKKLVEDFQAGVSIDYPTASGKYRELLHQLAVVGLVQMLDRAGLKDNSGCRDLLPYNSSLDSLVQARILPDLTSQLYFSPYQSLGPAALMDIFGSSLEHDATGEFVAPAPSAETEPQSMPHSVLTTQYRGTGPATSGPLAEKIRATTGSLEERTAQLIETYASEKQDVFYQVVVEAFQILGFDCRLGRLGQNGARCDAIIEAGVWSIPIEIKSPREEKTISVKAVRQALENRVILCNRPPYKTRINVSSLVVGYEYPPPRSEALPLIDAIYKTYGIRIALVSFGLLMELAVLAMTEGEYPDFMNLTHLFGLVTSEALTCE